MHASYEVTCRATGEGAVTDLVAARAIPRDIPGLHLLGALRFTPSPSRIAEDRWGQRVAHFELGRVPAGETRTVRWDKDFALFCARFHVVPERVGTDVQAPELRDYLGDAEKYELSSPPIAKLVRELADPEEGIYRKARVLYERLAKDIRYDRSSGWNGAAAVIERGTGSCSEYTFALVALLRRAGIPARYVGALSERGDAASFDDVFHRWAEAYFPGYGWVPLDANAAHDRPPGVRGSYFAGRSNRHVVTTISGGPSELLGWDYNSHETYRATPKAKLEVRQLARYRPLPGAEPLPEASAARVVAPRLVDPARLATSGDEPTDGRRHVPWWVAVVTLLAGGAVGAAVRRRMR